MTRYAAAAGFSAPEYAVTLHSLGNFSTFSASYYHRVSPDVEAGAKAIYDTKATTQGVNLEVGAKAYVFYQTCQGKRADIDAFSYLDSAAFIKAKINNTGILSLGTSLALSLRYVEPTNLRALGYTQALRPGVRASFGLAIDTQRLNDVAPTGPAHKIGASFTFEG